MQKITNLKKLQSLRYYTDIYYAVFSVRMWVDLRFLWSILVKNKTNKFKRWKKGKKGKMKKKGNKAYMGVQREWSIVIVREIHLVDNLETL